MGVLRLKLATDPVWVKNVAERNISEILTDHAWCEQKAASSAISLIVQFPEETEIVRQMSALVREEMEHFQQVHDLIVRRGYTLGRERKDHYVNDLLKFLKKGDSRAVQLVDRLLLGAMIEARSCERFRVLSENVDDKELAVFYRELMESEAAHYTLFIGLARGVLPRETVDRRWAEWLEYESRVILNYGKNETIHG
ncbi:MAG: tRNA-(ms[2]io[6]A)-hydroxylase [Flavobacteriales bacterium]